MSYIILSPDGFSINPEGSFITKKQSLEYFEEWKNRYLQQGYYSTGNERIPFEKIESRCKFIDPELREIHTLKKGEFFRKYNGVAVLVFDGYNRSTKKYGYHHFDDVNKFGELHKLTNVITDFEF